MQPCAENQAATVKYTQYKNKNRNKIGMNCRTDIQLTMNLLIVKVSECKYSQALEKG
jgi:hypothetical protein